MFEKKDYVFDISGDGISEEDRILEAIEQAEEQFAAPTEQVDGQELKRLDAEWEKIAENIRSKIEQHLMILRSPDADALKAASLENKVPLLYELAESKNYGQSTRQKLRGLADFISGELPKLTELQNSAAK